MRSSGRVGAMVMAEGFLLNDDLDLSERCDRELDNVSLQGKEIPVVFIPGNKFADAYSLRGRYAVTGDTVTVNAWVVNGKGRPSASSSNS